jgi:hypothetical protein
MERKFSATTHTSEDINMYIYITTHIYYDYHNIYALIVVYLLYNNI